MLTKKDKIFITGHNGMVGSSCVRLFNKSGYYNIITRTSTELDLRNQSDVYDFINKEKPDIIINCAAKVGGILANNDFPYEFIMNNLQIQNNLINSAYKYKVREFIFLGSSCVYPKFAPQPIKEDALLSSQLEETNQWYAIAKIAGIKSIEALNKQYGTNYTCLMPTNLYGPNDNFDLNSSHVIPALIRKFIDAKNKNNKAVLWGDGTALREFLHVDDLASAIFFILKNKHEKALYNVGSGIEMTIRELALIISTETGYNNEILWDKSKPNGTPRKIMDSTNLNQLGWLPKIDFNDGIKSAINWFNDNYKN